MFNFFKKKVSKGRNEYKKSNTKRQKKLISEYFAHAEEDSELFYSTTKHAHVNAVKKETKILRCIEMRQFYLLCDMINNGVNIREVNKHKQSIFHLTLIANREVIFIKLFEMGLYFESEDCCGHTPVYYAVKHSRLKALACILDRLGPRKKIYYGLNDEPILIASGLSNYNVIDLLLERILYDFFHIPYTLLDKLREEDMSMLEYIVAELLNKDDSKLLHYKLLSYAVLVRDFAFIDKLLQLRLNTNAYLALKKKSPISEVIDNKDQYLLSFLVSRGIQPITKQELHETLKLLSDAQASTTHFVFRTREEPPLRVLLDGLHCNRRDEHHANRIFVYAQYLVNIDKRRDENIYDLAQLLASVSLESAVDEYYTKKIYFLVKNHADVSVRDKFGMTPLDIILFRMHICQLRYQKGKVDKNSEYMKLRIAAMIVLLYSEFPIPNTYESQIGFLIAIHLNELAIVSLMIKKNLYSTDRIYLAESLFEATVHNNTEIIGLLLSIGANPVISRETFFKVVKDRESCPVSISCCENFKSNVQIENFNEIFSRKRQEFFNSRYYYLVSSVSSPDVRANVNNYEKVHYNGFYQEAVARVNSVKEEELYSIAIDENVLNGIKKKSPPKNYRVLVDRRITYQHRAVEGVVIDKVAYSKNYSYLFRRLALERYNMIKLHKIIFSCVHAMINSLARPNNIEIPVELVGCIIYLIQKNMMLFDKQKLALHTNQVSRASRMYNVTFGNYNGLFFHKEPYFTLRENVSLPSIIEQGWDWCSTFLEI